MATLTVKCPKCTMVLEAPVDLVGKPATCPGCSSQFVVSRTAATRPAEAVKGERHPANTSTAKPPPREAEPDPSGRLLSAEENGGDAAPRTATFKGLGSVDQAPSAGAGPSPMPTAAATAKPATLAYPDPPVPPDSSKTLANPADSGGNEPSPRTADDPNRTGSDESSGGLRARRLSRPSSTRRARSATLVEGGGVESRLQLGSDGTLPHLVVKELEAQDRHVERESGSNPMMLLIVLAVSVTSSVLLLFAPSGSGTGEDLTLGEALQQVRANYIGREPPFEEYQLQLREALQEENEGDRRAAKVIYRRILDMIHQEGRSEKGLTGPAYSNVPPNDKDLERLLRSLIAARN